MIRSSIVLAMVLMLVLPSTSQMQSAPVCGDTNELLVLSQSDGQVALKMTDSELSILAPESFLQVLASRSSWDRIMTTPEWLPGFVANETGYRVTVTTVDDSNFVFDTTFERRIELATFGHSQSGRFVVFIQANNVATEVTIFDASTVTQRELRLPHHATLSAFTVSLSFSRDESCLAVSMERYGGDGPEIWLIDLVSGMVGDPMPGSLLGWW